MIVKKFYSENKKHTLLDEDYYSVGVDLTTGKKFFT
jgi:hypothetical protein